MIHYVLTWCLFLSSTAFSYPKIKSWSYSPQIVLENKKQVELKTNSVLGMPFVVSTEEKDELVLNINGVDHLNILPNTRIQVLEINSDTESIDELYLLSGRLRLQSEFKLNSKKGQWPFIIKTPFFDLKVPQPIDFFVDLDMKKPSVEIRLVKGELPLEFFAYEKKLLLKAGQSFKFFGELADNKLALKYDFLLDGKKVPRGKMEEVKEFDLSEYVKADETRRRRLLQQSKLNEKLKLEKIKKQIAWENSFLCKVPFGQKDECAWILDSGKCFRKRCNVDGKWGDLILRPETYCTKGKVIVKPCDY